jgi:hypothetical protein
MRYNAGSWIKKLLILGIVVILTSSCKKDNSVTAVLFPPTVITTNPGEITSTSALVGGYTYDAFSPIIAWGVCWGTKNDSLSVFGKHTSDGPGNNSHSSTLTGLTSNTTYYVRAYAINGAAMCGYGQILSFSTHPFDIYKFSTGVYPLFVKYSCTGCHGNAGGLTLTGTSSSVRSNLINIGAVIPNSAVTSTLYTYFNAASHQGISLTPDDLDHIYVWINTGALNN